MDTHHEVTTAAPETSPAPAVYDSNPFTATWTGIQKLIKSNAHTVIGLAFFNILLGIILVCAGIAIFMTVISYMYNHDASLSRYAPLSDPVFGFLSSMSEGTVIASWVLGVLIIVLVSVLAQSLQLNLSIAGARLKSLKFGELLKQSFRSVPRLLGFTGLVGLTVILAIVAVGLLSLVLGYITLVVALIAIVAAIYVGLRITFAQYAIVDRQLGPVAAIKHSWAISQGHVIETVGSGVVALLVVMVPSLILDALARIAGDAGAVNGAITILSGVTSLIAGIIATMALAERYTQLHAVQEGTVKAGKLSSFNYLAILVFIVVGAVTSALSPRVETTDNQYNSPLDGIYDDSLNTDSLYPTNLN